MNSVESRIFDPHGDEEPNKGTAATWDEFLQVPWVQERTRSMRNGWYFSRIRCETTLATWRKGVIPYPYEDRGAVQCLVGERDGFVLGYVYFKTIGDYERFVASIPMECIRERDT